MVAKRVHQNLKRISRILINKVFTERLIEYLLHNVRFGFKVTPITWSLFCF